MRISEVMSRGVVCTYPDANLREAAAQMKAANIGLLPVCESNRLVGMLTDRDITVRATAAGMSPLDMRVRDVMTPDVVFCFEDQLVVEAAMLMQENRVRRLVVFDRDNRLAGIVSLGDLAVESGDEQLAEYTLEVVASRWGGE